MNASGKKIALVVAAVIVAVALAGYFIFIPNQEKKYEAEIAAFIESLPGDLAADSITVNFLANSAEVRGLRGTTAYLLDSEMQVDVESITVSGLNFSLGKETGVVEVADAIRIDNAEMQINMDLGMAGQTMEQTLRFKRMAVTGIKGDCASARELSGGTPLGRIMEVAATFSIASSMVEDYSNTVSTPVGPAIFSAESFSGKNMTLLSCGEGIWTNLRFNMVGMEIVRIERLGIEAMSMPNVIAPLLEAMEDNDPEALSLALLQAFRDEPFRMRGLTFEGMRLQGVSPEPMTLDKLRLDLDASTDSLSASYALEGLSVPASLYRTESIMAAQFGTYYQKPLNINSRASLVAVRTPDGESTLNLEELFLEDPALASISAGIKFVQPAAVANVYEMLISKDNLLFAEGRATLIDKALVQTFFESEMKALEDLPGEAATGTDTAGTVADMREAAAKALLENKGKYEHDRAIYEGIAQLLRQPGALEIRQKRNPPAKFSDPDFGDMSRWDSDITFSPAE